MSVPLKNDETKEKKQNDRPNDKSGISNDPSVAAAEPIFIPKNSRLAKGLAFGKRV